MQSAAEITDDGEIVQLSDLATHDGHIADRSADANGKRNPVSHRIFKTVCLYVSFGTMVRLSTCIICFNLYAHNTAAMVYFSKFLKCFDFTYVIVFNFFKSFAVRLTGFTNC